MRDDSASLQAYVGAVAFEECFLNDQVSLGCGARSRDIRSVHVVDSGI